VILPDGRELECDLALVSVGVGPRRELVAAEKSPTVHACGDVAGGPGHWTSAAAEAVDVARDLIGLDPLPQQPPFFWSDQFGLRLQLVGDTSAADRIEVDGSEESFVAPYLAAGGRLVAALASNRPAEAGRFRQELAEAA
jgi:3-phenylpropionate/trans-cinnamate dioxygenase ferredoxin reductase subunit